MKSAQNILNLVQYIKRDEHEIEKISIFWSKKTSIIKQLLYCRLSCRCKLGYIGSGLVEDCMDTCEEKCRNEVN